MLKILRKKTEDEKWDKLVMKAKLHPNLSPNNYYICHKCNVIYQPDDEIEVWLTKLGNVSQEFCLKCHKEIYSDRKDYFEDNYKLTSS